MTGNTMRPLSPARLFLVLWAVLALGACGGGKEEDASGGAVPLPDGTSLEASDGEAESGEGEPEGAGPPRSIEEPAWGKICGTDKAPRLEVSLAPEQDVIPLGELAVMEIRVKNAGEKPVRCSMVSHDILSAYLEILYENRRFQYIKIRKEYFDPIFQDARSRPYLPAITLPPGEAESTTLRFLLPVAGTYRVRAVYRGLGPSNLLFYASPWTDVKALPDGEAEALHALVYTDMGNMEFAFHARRALATCINFLTLVFQRFYDGNLEFHRVERHFIIQSGDPSGTGTGGPGYYIPQEFNRLPHLEGTLSMARASHVDTAGSQFFISLDMDADNQRLLDGQYTVFGCVVSGFETARKIGTVQVDGNRKPIDPVRITKITLVKR